MSEGEDPQALSPAQLALLGRPSKPTLPNQPPVPPGAHWRCTARTSSSHVTASVFWKPATAACRALTGFAATALRCFPAKPNLVRRRMQFVVARGHQRAYEYRGGMLNAFSGWVWVHQAPPFGSVHDFNKGYSGFLVPTNKFRYVSDSFGRSN